MNGAIMQPYLFPYVGYYQLAYEAEKFLFLDDVNYIKKGHINRNAILLHGKRHEFSIPVSKVSQNRTIHHHYYLGDYSVFLKLIEQSYKKSPHFNVIVPLIKRVILDSENNVARKNAKSITSVFEYLGISRNFLFSSDIHLEEDCKGQDRILALCKKLGIKSYCNAIGGQSLYSQEEFGAAGVELKFIKSNIQPYLQGEHEFVPRLSIIDVLMHCDRKVVAQYLADYSLV